MLQTVLGNGLSSLLLKQEWRWFLISLCTYSLVTGSTPAHKSYAIAIANNPQSLVPFWWPTFTTLVDMVGLGVCRMLHTCIHIVPSSTGTVCIESNKSTLPGDENLFDRQAQWSEDTCIIWTNLSGVDDHMPRCFNLHVSCRPFWVGNWDLNRQLAADICVAVNHLPFKSVCSSATDKPRSLTQEQNSELSGSESDDTLIADGWSSDVKQRLSN